MRRIVFWLCLVFIALSCNDGEAVNPSPYNQETIRGSRAGEDWTKTPESISSRIVPRGHAEGVYDIVSTRRSKDEADVEVTSGPFDDELIQEKWTLKFRLEQGTWIITKIRRYQKWRY